MATLIHVLGADIPHHNQTLLRFFNDTLSPVLPAHQVRRFMVVSATVLTGPALQSLEIERFSGPLLLARAVVSLARRDREARFFFHGQFNPWLWLALSAGLLARERVNWHIWGADLYEEAHGWHYQWFYRLRRYAQRRVGRVFATQGDMAVFHQRHPKVPASLLYFPTRLSPLAPVRPVPADTPLTILVGNSGDRSNRHLEALAAIHRQFGRAVRLIVPMGYPAGNEAYINQVAACGQALFGDEIEVLRDALAFEDYLTLLHRCHLGYFLFHRQQGIGTLCQLIQLAIPFVISRHNPFWQDLTQQQLPVLFSDAPLDEATLARARARLARIDTRRIAFFAPQYQQGWHQALALAAGDSRD
ncbi:MULTISPECIES: TDP-N-acetylfucosamine:lipid II N-acetylfucosaminyltransferase [Dickeya]|uniref:TDP-N-acetylfucosamine:lipid II N-acetylfucosaminyltransferase n=1 Tax=Dickeya aquatica TaxID=1401087 RepID=A0A375AGG2_9GAMM|nr:MULTISPECIES: TDP-N-acetylfucosamine:lipid II N-acetylfucosaminyltransferase [Dickeya]SLM64996.1 4-alpha-L-fucosyltransferase [Dickeya aquatica]